MNANTLRAISYITAVAAEELTILQWIAILNKVYPKGIPEKAKMGDAINYFVDKFPDFESKSQDDTQEGMDLLYSEFIDFIIS